MAITHNGALAASGLNMPAMSVHTLAGCAFATNLARNPGFANSVARAQFIAESEHGRDPCTRRQAAAHEAGHVVVYAALGATIDHVEIKPRRAAGGKLWLGLTRPSALTDGLIAEPAGGFLAIRQPSEVLARLMLESLAGLVGERAAELDHPASSIDEAATAQLFAVELAARFGVDARDLYDRAIGAVTDLLTRRAYLHRELTKQLTRHKQLSAGVVAALIASGGVTRINSALALLRLESGGR